MDFPDFSLAGKVAVVTGASMGIATDLRAPSPMPARRSR